MPARSVLTSTPFTARIDPTALSTGCHVCARAMLEVTAAGGGAIFAPMAAADLTCMTLKPTSTASNSPTAPSISVIRLNIDEKQWLRNGKPGLPSGLARP